MSVNTRIIVYSILFGAIAGLSFGLGFHSGSWFSHSVGVFELLWGGLLLWMCHRVQQSEAALRRIEVELAKAYGGETYTPPPNGKDGSIVLNGVDVGSKYP